jgi:hypothetical protein
VPPIIILILLIIITTTIIQCFHWVYIIRAYIIIRHRLHRHILKYLASLVYHHNDISRAHGVGVGRLVSSCSAYSSTLTTLATCPSETSVEFQRATQLYIPEDRIFGNKFYPTQLFYFPYLLKYDVCC